MIDRFLNFTQLHTGGILAALMGVAVVGMIAHYLSDDSRGITHFQGESIHRHREPRRFRRHMLALELLIFGMIALAVYATVVALR